MRKTAAFVTALLITASFMSGTYAVSAEETAEITETAAGQEEISADSADEDLIAAYAVTESLSENSENEDENPDDTEEPVTGWVVNEDGFTNWLDPETGVPVTGYITIDGVTYYFDNEGTLRTDWSAEDSIVETEKNGYTFGDMEQDIAELQQRYPVLVKVETIGSTGDGRQIYDIIIGNPEAENQTAVTACMKGSDFAQSRVILADAEKFLKNYTTGVQDGMLYSELFEKSCIHLIPVLNPDGVSIVQFGPAGVRNGSLRARVSSIYSLDLRDGYTQAGMDEYFSSWQANVFGVELERNTSAAETGDRTRPSYMGYGGTSVYSERETAALKRFTDEHPDMNMTDYAAFADAAATGCASAALMKASVGAAEDTEQKPDEQPAPDNSALYTEHLYRTLLRREPDAEGWKFWSERLGSGACSASEMLLFFAESGEIQKNEFTDEEFVRYACEAAFGRAASEDELSRFVKMLGGGYSREYVIARLEETEDFDSMCRSYGLDSGKTEISGWQETSEGTYYYENGRKVCDDLKNIDGFTYIFDRKGRTATGTYFIGPTKYYANNGFVLPRNGTDWGTEQRKENFRGETGKAQKMDVPLDFQFMYTRVICTIGGVEKRVRESGCGAASASMVIRYFTGETKYDPEYLFEWAYKNGQYAGYGLAEVTVSRFLGLAGIQSYWIKPSAEKVARALREGHPVIALAREGYFTTGGHYIVLTGITRDGYVTVNDPNNSSMCRMEFRLETVLRQTKCFLICGAEGISEI